MVICEVCLIHSAFKLFRQTLHLNTYLIQNVLCDDKMFEDKDLRVMRD